MFAVMNVLFTLLSGPVSHPKSSGTLNYSLLHSRPHFAPPLQLQDANTFISPTAEANGTQTLAKYEQEADLLT